jgi:hypothetical protein
MSISELSSTTIHESMSAVLILSLLVAINKNDDLIRLPFKLKLQCILYRLFAKKQPTTYLVMSYKCLISTYILFNHRRRFSSSLIITSTLICVPYFLKTPCGHFATHFYFFFKTNIYE